MSEVLALCLPLTSSQITRLEAASLKVVETLGEGPCPDDFTRARFAFGNPPHAWIAQARGLEWLQLESVGFGEYVSLPQGDPIITNLAGLFADPVAQSALAGILALNRGIDRLTLLRKTSVWVGDELRPNLHLLDKANVVLFGMGAINRRFAELLAPFSCRITAIRSDWRSDNLDVALASSDIISCVVPSTPATLDIFDARRLSLLPPHALFLNFGRGSLLDEYALTRALEMGRLRGAVIDVTRDEPLPSGHPFWTAPRMILTQHTGGGSADESDRKIDAFLANLARFRAGENLENVADFARGY